VDPFAFRRVKMNVDDEVVNRVANNIVDYLRDDEKVTPNDALELLLATAIVLFKMAGIGQEEAEEIFQDHWDKVYHLSGSLFTFERKQ
jgi:hypothetical protein